MAHYNRLLLLINVSLLLNINNVNHHFVQFLLRFEGCLYIHLKFYTVPANFSQIKMHDVFIHLLPRIPNKDEYVGRLPQKLLSKDF